LLLKLSTYKTPLRYFIVAACCFCIDFAIYAVLVAHAVSVYLANFVGFCIGVPLSVILIRAFVFPVSRFTLGKDVILAFVANGTMLAVGMGMLWVLVDWVLINPYWAKLLTNFTTFILNYVTRAIFFSKK
jgi:putative flippase GtrA